MSATRKSATTWVVLVVLAAATVLLWRLHAEAWSLGDHSPVLNYDTAQVALAASELAGHGRLATTFALPLELASHPVPPWPLAVVQPGLVFAEAALFRIAGFGRAPALPERLEPLTLFLPFVCFFGIAALLALFAMRLFETVELTTLERAGASLTLGLAFLLDPEAQHFAIGGFTELPFTLGLTAALAALAFGEAPRQPLLFGLLLGVTGSFRANMLWLAPVLALGAAALAERPRRARVLVATLLGFVLPLAPWWIYKWQAFGTPGWDLTRLVVWDHVGGRTWFSLFHRPEMPDLPHGMSAAGLLAAKVWSNLPGLLLAMALGPRALWFGALVLWIALARPPRAVAVAAIATLLASLLGMLSAAASIPWLRYLFPTRIPAEAAGVLALWALISRAPHSSLGRDGVRLLRVVVALLALGWGTWSTTRGLAEARAGASLRGVPSTAALRELTSRLDRELAPGEAVMSNLGPELAWNTGHPVVHLALTPDDLESCRRRLAFHTVLLVFRDPAKAWEGWDEIMARPDAASGHPEWKVMAERRFSTADGFAVVWLELGPLEPRLAMR